MGSAEPILQPRLRTDPQRRWLIAPTLLALLVGVPLIVVIAHVGAFRGETIRHLAQTVLIGYLANTVALVVCVAGLAGLVGTTSAWLTSVYEFPGRGILSWMLVLPLALPGYIAAYTYSGIFDFTGPAQQFFQKVLNLAPGSYPTLRMQSFSGLVFIMSAVLYPYVYITARAAFANRAAALLEICRSHGYGGWTAMRRAVLPATRPALAAGIALVSMEALGEYGASHYYGVDTLTIGILRAWFALGSVRSALSLAAVMLLVVAILMTAERRNRGAARFHSPSLRSQPTRRRQLHGLRAATAVAVCSLPVVVGFLVPVAQLLGWAAANMPLLEIREILPVVGTSVGLAVLAGTITIGGAILVAYAGRIRGGTFVRTLATVVTAGYAVPAAVLAIGIATTYTWLDRQVIGLSRSLLGFSPGLLITGSIVALTLGLVIRFFALGYQAVDAGFSRIPTRFDDVARSLGFRPGKTLLLVGLPQLRPAILGAAVLLGMDILKELPLTMILRPFNVETLATRVFSLAGSEMVAESAALSLMIVATGVAGVLLINWLSRQPVRSVRG